MTDFRKLTALDIAIRVTGTIVLALMVYLGASVYLDSRRTEAATPASRAVRNLEAAVKADPQNVAARLRLAEALAAANRTKDAVAQFDEALRIEPKNVDAMTGLGLIAMKEQRLGEAEKTWRSIIIALRSGEYAAQDQRLESAYYYLATVLIEQRKYSDSIGYLKEALRIRNDASDTHYLLSVAYKGLAKADKQREELDITLDFDPSMPEANYDLGQLLLAAGDEGGAAEHFRTSVDNAKSNALPQEALSKLGTAADRLATARAASDKDPKKALANARVALALDPNNLDAARLVGRAADKLKDTKKSLEAWKLVLTLAPGDPEATKALQGSETDGTR